MAVWKYSSSAGMHSVMGIAALPLTGSSID